MPIDHVNLVITTQSFDNPRHACAHCGAEVAYFAIDPNGRFICASCAGPNALIDVFEVEDAAQAAGQESED